MPLSFRKQILAHQSYESAGIAPFLGTRHLDIASGAWCYHGPDFRQRSRIWTPPECHQYYDDFSTISLDATGNGFPDIVTGGFFGKTLFLLKNPGEAGGGDWEQEIIDEPGHIETTRAWDLDGDGDLELVPNLPGESLYVYKLLRDEDGKPTGRFRKIKVSDQIQGHGLGAGDLNGNGRMDLLLNHGWLEAPKRPWEEEWIYHPDWSMPGCSIPILVHDVDGDGQPELISSRAHDYGLFWYKQEHPGNWTEYPIDPFNSQYHDMQLCDLDADGELELVTGKRYLAHNGNDPGTRDPIGLYYFKWTGSGFAKQVISYGDFGEGKGCGIHFAIADLNGNGRPDIVAPGKDGLCIFWNEGL